MGDVTIKVEGDTIINGVKFLDFLAVNSLNDNDEFVGFRADDGKYVRVKVSVLKQLFKGEPGKSVLIEYSADGKNWHAVAVEGDTYIRFKNGDEPWSVAFRIGGSNSGIPEAPEDDVLYGRKNAEWVEITIPTPPEPTGGGHVIVDGEGNELEQVKFLQFKNGEVVNENGKTVYRINAGNTPYKEVEQESDATATAGSPIILTQQQHADLIASEIGYIEEDGEKFFAKYRINFQDAPIDSKSSIYGALPNELTPLVQQGLIVPANQVYWYADIDASLIGGGDGVEDLKFWMLTCKNEATAEYGWDLAITAIIESEQMCQVMGLSAMAIFKSPSFEMEGMKMFTGLLPMTMTVKDGLEALEKRVNPAKATNVVMEDGSTVESIINTHQEVINNLQQQMTSKVSDVVVGIINKASAGFRPIGYSVNGTLYFGRESQGGIYKLDDFGNIVPANVRTGAFSSIGLSSDGTLYFGGVGNIGIWKLDNLTGNIVQTNVTTGGFSAIGLSSDGTLYFTGNVGIWKLDNSTGNIVQTNVITGRFESLGLSSDGTLYFAGNSPGIWKLDKSTGDIILTNITSGAYDILGLSSNGTLYFGGVGIWKLDNTTGNIVQTNITSGAYYAAGLSSDGTLYFGGGGIWKLDNTTGNIARINGVLGTFHVIGQSSTGTLYFGGSSGIWKLDNLTGNIVQTNVTSGTLWSMGLSSTGTLYFAGSSGIWEFSEGIFGRIPNRWISISSILNTMRNDINELKQQINP